MTTSVAAGGVLLWFAIELGPYVGQTPDLDGLVDLRNSLAFFRGGFHGLIAGANGAGIHPPLLELLNAGAFALFGQDPRSQQIVAVVLFVILAVAVERLLAPWLSAGERVVGALVVAICPSLAVALFLAGIEAIDLRGSLVGTSGAPGRARARLELIGLELLDDIHEAGP